MLQRRAESFLKNNFLGSRNMSCLFCNSSLHLSQFCNVYSSDTLRAKLAQSIDYCPVCFSRLAKYHNEFLCGFNLKCFICFSRQHHTFYCPNRFITPNFFVPGINEVLISRFSEMFDITERTVLGLSSLEATKLINLKPIRIRKNLLIKKDSYNPYLDSVNVAVDNFNLETIDLDSSQIKRFLKDLKNNQLLIKARDITLHDVELSSQELLLMLSSNTVSFHCNQLKVSSKITFSQIVKNVPNIKDIEIQDSDVNIDNSWPNDLMKYINGNNFKRLCVKINEHNFNAEAVALFMKRKCSSDVQIYLYIQESDQNVAANIKNNIKHFFVPATSFSNELLQLKINYKKEISVLFYTVKR